MTSNERDKLKKLSETCKLLELDIQELTSEIIESELSREQLISELKKARRQLYKEFEKIQETLSDSNVNTSDTSSRKHERQNSV